MAFDRIAVLTPVAGARETGSTIEPGALEPTAGVGGVAGIQDIDDLSPVEGGQSGGLSFGQALAQGIDKVNRLQTEADFQAQAVATGDASDLHTSAIAMERAALALQTAVQVTQKAISAYQEVSRMQL
jgi:flagellar hook-basal body complex protein FliE